MNCVLLNKLNNFLINVHLSRLRHTKHWNPKFKKQRQEKFFKPDVIKRKHNVNGLSEDILHTKMKERGIYPSKPWQESAIYISCTGDVFEPYIPPEGDGKFSSLSTIGAKQNAEYLMKKTKSYQAVMTIKKFEEAFDVIDFANESLDIYIKGHEILARKQKSKLKGFVTEKLFPELFYNLENKTIIWKFIKSLEPARVVHSRCTNLLTDDNIFAQITVRLHTEQILAVYDRFGRLMHGSEILKKNVLEYIVFEKHLSNEYGQWRLHSKIIPSWMPLGQCITKTFVTN
ncbi:PREDICTED: probable 39S ribosomal protein L45, mitochondrial [Ceratosolen solmsi marchali]|uniref:Large ribosomal subunit protein mL45 n=1 Tax=Ceratosolen solmsi marchali TaxID=326594 RepID=A0AAJ7E139_9HYME|nr:PREDICTED: probable 39S ribosomal protein L45, mitochondrial [Ceratosolen solmsi marchali]